MARGRRERGREANEDDGKDHREGDATAKARVTASKEDHEEQDGDDHGKAKATATARATAKAMAKAGRRKRWRLDLRLTGRRHDRFVAVIVVVVVVVRSSVVCVVGRRRCHQRGRSRRHWSFGRRRLARFEFQNFKNQNEEGFHFRFRGTVITIGVVEKNSIASSVT